MREYVDLFRKEHSFSQNFYIEKKLHLRQEKNSN